jgi:hypothetical protein
LKPVGDNYIFSEGKSVAVHELGCIPWENLCMFELKKIMHQTDNKAFSVALNNIALGMMSDEDLLLIKR